MNPRSGAIIGFGFIAERGHVPAYQRSNTHLEIVAVAEICEARRTAARKALPNARIYEDYSALLAAEGSRIEFVDIAVPPADHAKIAVAALKAGLHVLCEKPMATTLADAEGMVHTAEKVGRVLYPCHNYKHAPVVRAVRNVIESGEIGDVRLVTLQTFRTTHARGVSEWRPDWRRERALSGGGIAMDHGSHTFYLAFDWLRGYPSSLTAKMSTLGPHDTEDNFSIAMTFPNGIATSHLSWTAGVRKVIYTLHGPHGAVRVKDDDVEVSLLQREGATAQDGAPKTRSEKISSNWMDASHVTWFASMLGQFREAIDARNFVSHETRDAVECIRVITAAYASANEGCRELELRRPARSH